MTGEIHPEIMDTDKLMEIIYFEISNGGGITDKIDLLLKEVRDRLEKFDRKFHEGPRWEE